MKKWGFLKEGYTLGGAQSGPDADEMARKRAAAAPKKPWDAGMTPEQREAELRARERDEFFRSRSGGLREEDTDDLEEGWGYRKDDDEDPVDEGFMDTAKRAFSKKKTKPTHRTKQDTIKGYNKMRSSAADVEASNILKATQAYLEEPGTQNRGTLKALLQRIKKVLEAIAEKEVEQDAASTDGADEPGPGGFQPGAGNVQQIPAMNAAGAATQINPSMREGRSQKISVREAKEITRKIIKRIKKESN